MRKFLLPLLFLLICFVLFNSAEASRTRCPKVPLLECPLYITELCYWTKNGASYQTDSNGCFICQDKDVVSYSIGPCP